MIKFLRDTLGPLKPCAGGWWESEIEGNCEHGISGIAQPINAWSNLSYGLFGLLVVVGQQFTAESIVMALMLLILTAGSWLYHALPSIKTAAADHFGMYTVFGALAAHSVGANWLFMLITALAAGYVFRFAFHFNTNVMMGVFLWFSALALWSPDSNFQLIASFVVFAIAYFIWQLDKRRLFTGRWGHGVWHLLTSIAILLMYLAGV